MSLTREVRGRGMDVREPEMLASLAVRPPTVEEFEFVKFRLEGDICKTVGEAGVDGTLISPAVS